MGKKRNARKRRLPMGTAPPYGSTDDLTQLKTSKISTSTGKNNDFIEISDEDIIEIIEPAELLDAGPSKLSETLAIMHTDTSDKIDALLNARNFIIVQGSYGCGKTHAARILSQRRRIPLYMLQINDQFDSKVLYGYYKCTEVPGEFIWQQSKFAECLQQKCLILLENIDHGGSDLTASILTLIDNGSITLTNGTSIKMNPDCRIMATISLQIPGDQSHIPLQLREYPYSILMPDLRHEDLSAIITISTPRLNPICEKLIKTYFAVSKLIRQNKTMLDRTLNSNDLFRSIRRLETLEDLNDNRTIFLELLDVWIMHLANMESKEKVARAIGETLSLSLEEQNYFINIRQPEIKFEGNTITLGRVTLERRVQEISHTANFVFTRDSSQLLERLSICLQKMPPEPVLLTGETGVGKTTAIQHLAEILRVQLRIVNLSQDSEFMDLVGGYKPTSPANVLRPLAEDYLNLFKSTFNEEKNGKFLSNINKCFNGQRYGDFLQLLIKSSLRAYQKYPDRTEWIEMVKRARRLTRYFGHGDEWRRRMTFSYVKGVMSEAVEQGHWLLVDEINLASAECLDALAELLEPNIEGSPGTRIHPDFRLFSCMNNATDIGKRSLPSGIRSKFTEFCVLETTDCNQLRTFIHGQIPSLNKELVDAILDFYIEVSAYFPKKFSLRTLSRALLIAADQEKSIVHSFKMAFSSQLNIEQREKMHLLLEKHFKCNASNERSKQRHYDSSKFVCIENSLIPRGKEPIIDDDNSYTFTPSVRSNMAFMASIVETRRFPILMEGETSAGKTSMIMQLAKMCGKRIYRINNHEHTDIQEYIGTYAPDTDGRLQFVEGIVLKAIRNGDWIILDELNLAPSSVLEALNRLLDDNRELFVPELNATIKAHPHFQLFATQNPVGYAGRKRLSRAFLSRFMVMQCNSYPLDELPQIVYRRCGIAPKQAQLMVTVLEQLKSQRAIAGIFASSSGLMTLRDLFRWGNRVSALDRIDDWRQAFADQGYFVLGTRCRNKQDMQIVVEVLEKQLGRRIDIDRLFSTESPYMPQIRIPNEIVMTTQMRRMLILCSEAWKCNEPVILVGDTGCGKTTSVHLFGSLLSINCHERTDTADLLGSIRPIPGGEGFHWQDGIVLQAMRNGRRLLIDEISLAPDSVLERLNSLLEPERTILLTDAGAGSNGFEQLIKAMPDFQLVATMNPGNDYGKKELSNALRNRFTEIWCPQEHNIEDFLQIIYRRLLTQDFSSEKFTPEIANKVAQVLVEFNEFFSKQFNEILRYTPTTRDLIALTELFIEFYLKRPDNIHIVDALYHSIEANLLDAIGILPSRMAFDRQEMIKICQKQYKSLIIKHGFLLNEFTFQMAPKLMVNQNGLSIGSFTIEYSHISEPNLPNNFSLDAPTTSKNSLRIARALYSNKPIMIEGSPGAGKSSLVMALAAATGHKLVRLNLSEQTDLYDLFGSDIPIIGPDGQSTIFEWRDGPVLKAIKEGNWILLDEMNLASQSVLEGLNSCFDFRKNIYIAELDKTFHIDMDKCKFFACQNPHSQGGDRRALPKSFLNRFISIFVEEMTDDDFIFILCEYCQSFSENKIQFTEELISKMVLVNKLCRERVQNDNSLAIQTGGPFEYNLRDLFRWVDAVKMFNGNVDFGFDLIYLSRLKYQEAREKVVSEIYNHVFTDQKWAPSLSLIHINIEQGEATVSFGNVDIRIQKKSMPQNSLTDNFFMATQMELIEKLAACSYANWLVVLAGPSHVGKKSAIKALAQLNGQKIECLRLTSATDALDLLGSFEQISTTLNDDQIDLYENLLENESTQQGSNIRFEWKDSVFLQAYREGHWLLVEDANCCNSAVLDCLNTCLESVDGQLVLPIDEIRTIKRHPKFRIFFTMNPQNGQLSRAMRNRAVEIQFCNDNSISCQSLWSQNIYDTITTIFGSFPTTNSTSVKNSPQTIHLLQRLQTELDKKPTNLLLKSMALTKTKIKNEKPILREEDFQWALNILLRFLNEEMEDSDGLQLVSVPKEFPPLTRPYIPKVMTNFHLEIIEYYIRCFHEISIDQSTEALKSVCVQLSKLMQEFVIRNNNCNIIEYEKEFYKLTDLISIQHRWEQFSSKASNETAAGHKYIESLHDRKCIGYIKPFHNKNQEIKLFATKWQQEQQQLLNQTETNQTKIMSVNCRKRSSPFLPLQQYLIKINGLLKLAFDDDDHQSSSTAFLLPSMKKEDAELFSFSRVMSFDPRKLFPNNDFDGSATLYSHLNSPFLTLAANKLFWSSFQFSKNILQQFHIGELANAQKELEQMLEFFWNLSFSDKGIHETLNNHWGKCQSRFSDTQTQIERDQKEKQTRQWLILINTILEEIDALTPPHGIFDPPYFNHHQHLYNQRKMENLDNYFYAIQQFLQLTVAKNYEYEQISTALLRMKNCPIFFKTLSEVRSKTIATFQKLKSEDHYPNYMDDVEGRIYRGIWMEGEEEDYEQNFTKSVLQPLRNCTAHLREFYKEFAMPVLQQNSNLFNIERTGDVEYFCAKLLNGIHTIETLKTRILDTYCTSNMFPTMAVYPDLLVPYQFLLNCLVICLSEIYQIGQNLLQKKAMIKQHLFETNIGSIFTFDECNKFASGCKALIIWIFSSNQNQIAVEDKLQICQWAYINSEADIEQRNSCLQWLLQEWDNWYEENARQRLEQLFVIKQTKLHRSKEQQDMEDDLDLDEREIRAYLPDFHVSNFDDEDDQIIFESQESGHLTGDQLYTALFSISKKANENILPPFLNLMSILDQLQLYSTIDYDTSYLLNFRHLIALNELREIIDFNNNPKKRQKICNKTKEITVINVYKESDPSALIQCVEAFKPLVDHCTRLLAEFPENAQLLQLQGSVLNFTEKMPASAPLMKHAAQLEKILEHAENWESISDRAHSIRQQMLSLQEILVDWRRREVQCWSELIKHVQNDTTQLAVLVSWPLFKCALDTIEGSKNGDNSKSSNTLLVMFLDWIHNSTLGDFEARLWSGHLLAQFLTVIDNKNQLSELSTRINSILAHYEQFTLPIRTKYSELYKPIETEMLNFMNVVRYTDLNLWSVHDSVKRAHAQLFRILRKLKLMCTEPLSAIFLDRLPIINETTLAPLEKIPTLKQSNIFDGQQSPIITNQLFAFGCRFENIILELLDLDILDSLRQNAFELRQIIQTDLIYANPKSELSQKGNDQPKNLKELNTANEKLQGRSLFERQHRFSELVRNIAKIGLTARKAQRLNSEALTIQILSEVPLPDIISEKIHILFRHVAACRNVFQRQLASVRRHEQPHLLTQVSVANLENLRGITEYGLHWLFTAISRLAKKEIQEHRRLQEVSKCFHVDLKNAKWLEQHSSPLSYQQMSSRFDSNRNNIEQMVLITDRMHQLLSCSPKSSTSECNVNSIRHLQESLGSLHQDSKEYLELNSELDSLRDFIKRIQTLHDQETSHILQLPIGDDQSKGPLIWSRHRWISYESAISELFITVKASITNNESKIHHFFPTESERICSLSNEVYEDDQNECSIGQHEENANQSHQTAVEFEEVKKSVLLHFQSIYHKIEHILNNGEQNEAEKSLNSVGRLIEFIGQMQPIKQSELLSQFFLLNLIETTTSRRLPISIREECCALAKGASELSARLLNNLNEFICQLASFQTHWIEIGCHILSKGFVNPIPKPESSKGDDERVDNGCGFGDGDLTADATDVSGQVETMEQIEGLKDTNPSENIEQNQPGSEQQEKLPDVENPIEMDDDFAGDLEGLDTDEQNEHEQEEIDDHEGQTDELADWNFGDIEEPENTQLDPKLWEPEEQQHEEHEENAQEGLQELTGEMAASQEGAQDHSENDERPSQNENNVTDQKLNEEDGDGIEQQENISHNNEEAMDIDEHQENEEKEERTIEDQEQEGEVSMETIEEQEQNDQADTGENMDDEQRDNFEKDEINENSIEKEPLNDDDDTVTQQEEKPQKEKQSQTEAIGIKQGIPDAQLSASEKLHEEDAETGTNNEQLQPHENAAANLAENNGTAAAQEKNQKQINIEDNEAEAESTDQNESSPTDGVNTGGMSNADLEENDQLKDSEKQKLSAHANSTLEQARRTRILFDENLRRIKKSMTEELAEMPTQEGMEKTVDENEQQQHMYLESEDFPNEQIEKRPEGQNIFINFDNIRQESMLTDLTETIGSNSDNLLIDRLCSEFDKLEKEQHEKQDGQKQTKAQELQLKWALITDSIVPLAAELTELLRTILEPTIANRLQGDYRTGKRLNMRRLITYIASDYRKDRIWMRRTKRAKRNYQICIAIDNSQSMQYNHMTEITCNALCLIERAFRQLEVGELAICSFGSQVNLISDFTSVSGGCENPNLGYRILQELTFEEQRTDLTQMLSFMTTLFKFGRDRSNQPAEQMLIILGDGRGIFTEGTERIRQALNLLNIDNVTVLFLVLDCAAKSITEMRIADFANGNCTFHPYMQSFPFHLYALVKNTHSLPTIVAESVRQWFEYTSRS